MQFHQFSRQVLGESAFLFHKTNLGIVYNIPPLNFSETKGIDHDDIYSLKLFTWCASDNFYFYFLLVHWTSKNCSCLVSLSHALLLVLIHEVFRFSEFHSYPSWN